MRRLLLLTAGLLCLSNLAFAQADPGSIDIFTDPGYTSCNLFEPGGPSLTPVYIVHTHSNAVTASVWMLEATDGAENLVPTGESNAFPTTIGGVWDGISVAYGACMSSPSILMVTVNFFYTPGTVPACALLSIIPDDDSQFDSVEVVDCSSNRLLLPRGGQARVNPDAGCNCDVPAHETSWGGIKALYR